MLRLALSILTVISTSGLAQELVSFENGQVAEAADVNANFSLLLEKIESLQQRVQSLESSSQASFGCTGKVAAFSPVYREEFDFDRAYINVPSSEALHLSNAFTIEARVKLTAYPDVVSTGTGTTWVINKRGVAGDNREYGVWIDHQGYLWFDVFHDGTLANATRTGSNDVVPLNQWVHLAISSDGVSLAMHIGGKTTVDNPMPSPQFQGTSPLNIGGADNAGRSHQSIYGYLDEVRISDVARYQGADFLPSEQGFSLDNNTLLLMNFEDGLTNLGTVGGDGSPVGFVNIVDCS